MKSRGENEWGTTGEGDVAVRGCCGGENWGHPAEMGNRSTEHKHGAKQLRLRQRWNPPPPPSSRVLWVSHSPSASGWSDTQGCDPPARGLPGALCRPDPPREGSSPAELPTHPRAASRVSKEPAAPRPRPLPPPAPPPGPRGPLCLGGTFRLFPSRRPAGPPASQGAPIRRELPRRRREPLPPDPPTSSALPQPTSRVDIRPTRSPPEPPADRRRDPCPARPPTHQQVRRSRAPGGRAGGRAERADAGPVAADAPRRLRLRPPPLAPSAPRGPPAASRVAEPPAQHGSRAAEPRGRPSTPGSGAGEERGGGVRAAGPRGAGETAAAALVRLRARCFLSLGGCGLTPPPVPRSERERGGKKKKRKKKKTFIETIQPAAAEKKRPAAGASPPPPARLAWGSATPAGGGDRAGRGLAWGWGLWPGRGLGGAGVFPGNSRPKPRFKLIGRAGRPCRWTERCTVPVHHDW